ncbi:MAG: hypothetical protein P8X55_19890 [Desulfosarcinaceae bacterium]
MQAMAVPWKRIRWTMAQLPDNLSYSAVTAYSLEERCLAGAGKHPDLFDPVEKQESLRDDRSRALAALEPLGCIFEA